MLSHQVPASERQVEISPGTVVVFDLDKKYYYQTETDKEAVHREVFRDGNGSDVMIETQ